MYLEVFFLSQGITLAVGKIPDEDGEQQVDETPKTENTDVEPIDPPDESEDPGTEIRAAKCEQCFLLFKHTLEY